MSGKLIVIAPSRELVFEPLLDGVPVFDLIDYQTRIGLYEESLQQLNNDVDASAELLKDNKDGIFGWCVTWDQFRSDDLVAVPYYYYILAVVRYMKEHHGITSIKTEVLLPQPVLDHMRYELELFVAKHEDTKGEMREWARKTGSPLRMLAGFLKQRNVIDPEQLAPQHDNYVFGQVDKNFKANRYKGLLNGLKQTRPLLFSRMLFDKIDGLPEEIGQVDFFPFYSHGLLLKSWLRARKLNKQMRRINKAWDTNLMFSLISEQSVSQMMLMILRYELMQKAIAYYRPKTLFVVTAFADTVSRLATTAAAKAKVPVVMVSARPMCTSLRAEERSTSVDWSGINGSHVADYFIVRDAYSKQTFLKQGIASTEVFEQSMAGTTAAPKQSISKGFLMLFSHDNNLNELFLSTLEHVKKSLFGTIYYRMHPMCKLSAEQLARLKSLGFMLTDTSTFPIFDIAMEDIIAVTINSTAAIEVSSRGAGLVWLPYHTERSLPFAEVMSTIGMVSYSDDMFAEILTQLTNNDERQQLIAETNASYNANFQSENTYTELFEKLAL